MRETNLTRSKARISDSGLNREVFITTLDLFTLIPMSRQRRVFEAFLVIYILSGVLLVIALVNFQAAHGLQLSRAGLIYLYAATGWTLVTILFYLIAYIRIFSIFAIPVVFLVVGIVGEALTVTLIVALREEIDVKTRYSTLLVVGIVTVYLVLLQIVGVLVSIVYYCRTEHDFYAVPSK